MSSTVWAGKVGLGVLGFVLGGPIGALVGVLVGHQLDRGMASGPRAVPGGDVREIFFRTTFLAMGRLAKADGRVSEEEIRAARAIMHQMGLGPEDVQLAIGFFTEGKSSGLKLDEDLKELARAARSQSELLRAFLELQLEVALAGGSIGPVERSLLWNMSEILGVGRVEFAQLEALVRARRGFAGRQTTSRSKDAELAAAYRVLGVGQDAPDQDVKKAYRRLMNRHHPDKIAAHGLPESMLESAKTRTREIRAAWDLVKEQRGLR